MPRTRRYIQAGRPHELILRVREGLPFRPGPLINTLLEGIIARTQRDHKVTLCHYLWMSNHVHIILIPHCPRSCVNFYQEIQKKITDTFKRLLGKKRLCLWEGDPVLAQILDLDKAIDRVAYLYANPARANIVETIGDYQGASSWNRFSKSGKTTTVPWVRLPALPKLPTLNLNKRTESDILSELLTEETQYHHLTLKPEALGQVFGTSKDIKDRILNKIKEKEQVAALTRKATKKTLGFNSSRKQMIFSSYYPKKKPGERRIFVLSSDKWLRISFILSLKEFCAKCTHCYELLLKRAKTIDWPTEAFRPYAPPLSSLR